MGAFFFGNTQAGDMCDLRGLERMLWRHVWLERTRVDATRVDAMEACVT